MSNPDTLTRETAREHLADVGIGAYRVIVCDACGERKPLTRDCCACGCGSCEHPAGEAPDRDYAGWLDAEASDPTPAR